MSDPNRIRGDVGVPFGPERPKEDEKIDPEKFKKVMKVDESDEAQKRHKRRLRKEEEEGEEEEPISSQAPPPTSSFSEFMEDKEQVDNLFDKQSPGIRKQAVSETPPKAPAPGMITTEGVQLGEEPPEQPAPSPYATPPPRAFEEEPPPPPAAPPPPEAEVPLPLPSEELPEFEEAFPVPPKEEEQPPPPEKETKKPKKKEKDVSLLATQPKKGALKKKKAPAKPKPKVEKVPPRKEEKVIPETPEKAKEAAKEKKITPEIPEEKKVTPPPPGKRTPIATFERLTPTQIREKKLKTQKESAPLLVEAVPIPPSTQAEMGMMGEEKKEKEDEFPFIDSNALTMDLPALEQTLPSVTPPSDLPAVSKLSPQVHELFSQMAGTIMIQQHSGVTSTTITINMPNTIFNGSQVVLDQYSTAPNSYNIQLIGNAQAVNAFNENLTDLVAAFRQSQYAFEVNILKPALTIKKPLIRRKGSAGGGGKKKK